jgi:hypothetical protein
LNDLLKNLDESIPTKEITTHIFDRPLGNFELSFTNSVSKPKRFSTYVSDYQARRIPNMIIIAHLFFILSELGLGWEKDSTNVIVNRVIPRNILFTYDISTGAKTLFCLFGFTLNGPETIANVLIAPSSSFVTLDPKEYSRLLKH